MPMAKNYDVMVLCDDDTLREDMLFALEVIGKFPAHRLFGVKSRREAISTIDDVLADSGRIGVLVANLKLPDLKSGIDPLLERMSRYSPPVPVIATSIAEPERVANYFVNKGAFAYVDLCGSFNDLLGPVGRALGYW